MGTVFGYLQYRLIGVDGIEPVGDGGDVAQSEEISDRDPTLAANREELRHLDEKQGVPDKIGLHDTFRSSAQTSVMRAAVGLRCTASERMGGAER